MAASGHGAPLIQLYHHVVLPRNVPGRQDSNVHDVGRELATRLNAAVKALALHLRAEDLTIIEHVQLAIRDFIALNRDGKIDRNLLFKELNQLSEQRALILHVTEQNVGLLIYRRSSDTGVDSVVFEAFEASATCERVLAAENALQWDFPGQAALIPYETFSNEDFQLSLCSFLEQSSLESIKRFAAVTFKARAPLPEIRDTSDPVLITGALMTILRSLGSVHTTSLVRKRVRDSVSFENAEKPWRRSPPYLILRVAIQRHLYRAFGADIGRLYYKVIMSIFLAKLLDEGRPILPDDALHSLRTKLGHRLAKLEVDQSRGSEVVSAAHHRLFLTLEPALMRSLGAVDRALVAQWDSYKRQKMRVINKLPSHASDDDMKLDLKLSAKTLGRALASNVGTIHNKCSDADVLLDHYETATALKPFVKTRNDFLELCAYEEQTRTRFTSPSTQSPHSRCHELAEVIETYTLTIQHSCLDYAQLKSLQLLKVMEFWKSMDESAVVCYPLLREYHPWFEARMLDDLQLSTLEEYERLKVVETYITARCQGCTGQGSKTIFENPSHESFAARYFDACSDVSEFRELRRNIELYAQEARKSKEREWEYKSEEHASLMIQHATSSCVHTIELDDHGRPVEIHQEPCQRCDSYSAAKKMIISIYEHPLPRHEPSLKTVIFELACPKAFAAYRDATWLILSTFSDLLQPATEDVRLIRNYIGLHKWANRTESYVTLGSCKKSHLEAHWKKFGFPVPFQNICRSLGFWLEYYDTATETFIERQGSPCFATLLPLSLPSASPYQSFEHVGHSWPTSNKVLTSQSKCPPDLNVHEYMAWQGLLVGTHIRWPSLLREMGSTNLSFSTDSTWAIVTRVILQVGPSNSTDVMRNVHCVFRDDSFCDKLLSQIEYRLEAVRRNWREPTQLDILMSMLLKIMGFTSNARIHRLAERMLIVAREITQGWCVSLRADSNHSGNSPTVFAIWAAVLCKRTFYHLFAKKSDLIPAKAFGEFIAASIILQNYMVARFESLPHNLRNAILRDFSLAHASCNFLQCSLEGRIEVLLEAVDVFWPIPIAKTHHSVSASFDLLSHWVTMTLHTKGAESHHIHYNIVHGTLLVDGKELGMLPPELRRHPIVEGLFGPQTLRTLPSPLLGMSLVIDRQMPNRHRVHFGFRDKCMVIRAQYEGAILELIPASTFKDEWQYDLPTSLIVKCYHWLNITTGIIEIRQLDPWKSKPGNWCVNVVTRRATRNNGSCLINPGSRLAQLVARNFHQFEYEREITVYQPANGRLRVELKRLELDFVVTDHGWLLCPQLGSVISRNQDIGTWYGLRSKLALHAIGDPTRRSVILPMGPIEVGRDGLHVSIVIKNKGEYLKFEVNDIIGRMDCPAEPLMLYHRALYHAITAHYLPDPLTGRSGAEEALHYLESGAYLPWKPLSTSAIDCLMLIAKISPKRSYYPLGLKIMELVKWDGKLTTTIQDDRYRRVVETILQRNEQLCLFSASPSGTADTSLATPEDMHLENRAIYRTCANRIGQDQIYSSRDHLCVDSECANIAGIANMLCERPSTVVSTNNLSILLEKLPLICGYTKLFDKVQITDILEVDLGLEWGALIRTALECTENKKYHAVFLFSLLAFSANVDVELLHTIVSFSLLPDLQKLSLPEAPAYLNFRHNEGLHVEGVFQLLWNNRKHYVREASCVLGQLAICRIKHDKATEAVCKLLAKSICAQWPSKQVNVEILPDTDPKYLNRESALLQIQSEWDRLLDNFIFSQHLDEVQLVLLRHSTLSMGQAESRVLQGAKRPHVHPSRIRGSDRPTLQALLKQDFPPPHQPFAPKTPSSRINVLPHISPVPLMEAAREPISMPTHLRDLKTLVAVLQDSPSPVHRRYGNELGHSINALALHLDQPENFQEPFNPSKLSNDIFNARVSIQNKQKRIKNALESTDQRAKWLSLVGLWPKMTLFTLLTELRTTSGVSFGAGMKEVLVDLGVAITQYQRLLRLQEAWQKGRQQQVDDERANTGHLNWSPLDHVDWLLLEIDSNLMLRQDQVDVALATISPSSGQNSVVQLLMGKGKTSCILPMVALHLANENLFRMVVPRPLLLQSAQIMQAKLGGLLNREVMHIPFSRKTHTTKALMQTYCSLHSHIKKRGGIIITLPEHVLSFKLGGLQRLCDGKHEVASIMIMAQTWINRNARDVLDESDVSLAIRTQLIYPSGSQQTVDGHPHRWQTIQALLGLVHSYLEDLVSRYPRSIEIVNREGFPLIYFLRTDVQEYLVGQVVQKISRGQTAILPVSTFSVASQQDIRQFISMPQVNEAVTKRISHMFREKRHLVGVVYHLRGLFVHRILLSTLKKRWNVQYGLHPTRDPIAVPYQAKGIPSPTSEWGHPDVALILTCLSFYYEGLNMTQFKQAIEQLAKSDEPSIEYSLWVAERVPEAFKNYNAINIEDSQQLCEIFEHVRYKVRLLDFYLNNFVFPQHAKQFSKKLSASGSDLVLYNPNSPSRYQTTGFSGTNDVRHQLPMTIKQNDLPALAHTNAEVLVYLLETRNDRYVQMVDRSNKRLTEEGILEKLLNPYGHRSDKTSRIRILIDAGAQILGYTNLAFAKLWKKFDHEALAVIYFDEEHRPRAIFGKNTDIPLAASPFAERLEDCLVYIDESHCRGTDLKLPLHARAALTLGPHLTKDALTQAAMRLRLLGKTQAVTFFSPPEVHQSILDLRSASEADSTTEPRSLDVVRWLLDQTCNSLEQLEPLYYKQNIDYMQHTQARLDHPDFLKTPVSRDAYLSVVRSDEMRSLEQLYGPKHQAGGAKIKVSSFHPSLQPHVSELLDRKNYFQDRGLAVQSMALEEVEQEREMEHEVECVRETQVPIHFKALKVVKLHPDLKQFALSGRLPAGSDAYLPMFYALQKTALGLKHGTIKAANESAGLYVSTQFTRTASLAQLNDDFLRPGHWLLWSAVREVGLLVSPEEADLLIPILHASTFAPSCHLIVYAAPITRRMLQFNSLNYYAIPALPSDFIAPKWLKVEMGIFTGRLYFEWNEHDEILSYLGIQVAKGLDDIQLPSAERREPFATKPLSFLHEWLAIRRKGQDFEHTPMGFITAGKPLFADHSFFAINSVQEQVSAGVHFDISRSKTSQDGDDESEDGDDHAKEHLFQTDGVNDGDDDVFHDAEEELEENEENTFFDGKAYVDVEDEDEN